MSLPVVVWVIVILYYSVNLPWYDDFDPFPDFLHKWITSDALSDRIKLLFQPNNEHRMVVGKLATLTYYWVTGHLNFTFLHIGAALFTLGTLAVFWRAFRRSNLSGWYFLPVPFLLFQLQYHLIFLWAICGWQHEPVVFFVVLTMFLLSGNRFAGALLAGVCATYAMSSGIFVWPAGVAVLLLRSQYKQLAAWILVGAVAVGLYFYGMSAQGNESSFAFFAQYPHLSVLGFFAFLGGLFDFFPEKTIVVRSALPVIMAFTAMIWVVIWLWRQLGPWQARTFGAFRKQLTPTNTGGMTNLDAFLLGILSFLLVEALVIGLLRPRFGFFVMIVSNYKIYPALFLTVVYLTFIVSAKSENLRKRALQVAAFVGLAIWGISIYATLPVIAERRKYYSVNGYNQEHNGFGLGHVPYSEGAKYVDSLMKELVSMGVYSYPKEGNELGRQVHALTTAFPVERQVTVTHRDKGIYINDPEGTISPLRSNGEYAFVRNAQRLYFFKMEPHKYAGRNFFKQYDKGFDIEIPHASLLPGTYDLGVVNVEGTALKGGILGKVTIP
ncbi:hypothetical protein GCM10010967_06960 [Dyadobacter beijingensis]|uniref:Dolichyl-phosphate-mannose-protein mannosyltransferase n=2 Tax=Dyadobacter beijingensis TaxID=365489 RepID=A0ABQ2HEY0_9BACT|nr:hypothetical protein GCM10010967_06960 [Dyadobacter beijingensis]